ncbi:MAG: alpha/beta hydrolase [Steroidobacteraceae bacterium]
MRSLTRQWLRVIFPMVLAVSAFGAELPRVTTGHIERLTDFPSRYVAARNVDVWLPDGYGPGNRYAVIYAMDGQMLFDPATTWNHQSWRFDAALGALIATGRVRDAIVVGVWNDPKLRHAEYFPQKSLPFVPPVLREKFVREWLHGRPLADRFLHFLVGELKPAIDARFLTDTRRENTFILGSSMGGMISLYALSEYPDVFGGAACLSTHWIGTFSENASLPLAAFTYLQSHLPDPRTHRIYMDRGTVELDALYGAAQPFANDLFHERGYTDANFESRVYAGAGHNEKDWGARLAEPLLFLLVPPAR